MTLQQPQLFRSWHPLVWWVIGGTMLTTVTSFMVMPFMALYMAAHTKAPASTIGLVIGSAAITSVLFSLIGGSLSDRFGRKQMMILSVALTVLNMIGFANARSVWEFLVLSIFAGLSQAMFQPATSALLTDVTSPEKRGDVFALRYWSINVGAAVGPILGGYFGTVATGWTFYLAAGTSFIYLVIITIVFPGKKPSDAQTTSGGLLIRRAAEVISKDKALLLFMIAGFASSLGYSQIDTNLPQQMTHTMDPLVAAKLFGFILASNAIEVVVLQIPITKLVKRLNTIPSMMTGQFIFAVGYLLISFAHAPWMYFLSMFVITVGEIIVFPQNSKYVSDLAVETQRGAYFGASNMSYLGAFVGPWLGGMVLSRYGGTILFVIAGVIVAAGIPFYKLSESAHKRVKTRNSVPHSKTADL